MRVLIRPFTPAGDTGNPYNDLLNAELRALGVELFPATGRNLLSRRFDLVHLHWPEHFLRLNERKAASAFRKGHWRLAQLALARRRGIKVIWTIHNLHSHRHRHPRLENWYFRHFTNLIDGLISPSHLGLDMAIARYTGLRDRPAFVIPHGHYRDVYPSDRSSDQAREKLGIAASSRLIGFFGGLRTNKNVETLIRAFRELADSDVRLLIVGDGDDAYRKALQQLAAADSRIQLVQERVASADIQLYLNAMDLVVLPFKEILTSGSAILALSFNRPVLLPNSGALPELAEQVGEQWSRCYDGKLDSKTLASALVWSTLPSRPREVDLRRLDWKSIGKETYAAYRSVLDDS
jgi:glycosyltransferase involved in cell wall biosynthesis